MPNLLKRLAIYTILLLLMASAAGCAYLADRFINRVEISAPYNADPEAERLHQTLFMADLHSDFLLWDRPLLERSSYGHVDLPRLQEGGVGLQVFSVVTKFPVWMKLDGNTGKSDIIKWLVIVQGRTKSTWSSLMERAQYQGEKLNRSIHEAGSALKLITSRHNLRELVEARDNGEPVIGAMLALEGAHAIEDKLTNLERLYDLGFRIIGLTHFFDNETAGSAHGVNKGGLTALGREVVRQAQDRGMLIDLAHASPDTIDDVLAMADKPVIVSHTGVRGTCDTVRNLSDRHIRGIAASGGVIGIGLFKYAVCGDSIEDTVKAMQYVADLVGIKHVALGSDFDGSKTAVDVSGLVLLTQNLLEKGFSKEEVRAILGGNVLRVLLQTLPET